MGMFQQHLLDLARIDVRAAGNHQILGPVHQRQIPIRVEPSDITGMQPTAPQGFRRGLRIVPVFLHHTVAADQDFPGLAHRNGVVVGIRHADLGIREGQSDRPQTLQIARLRRIRDGLTFQTGDGHGAFALTVDLDQARTQLRQRGLRVFDIHRSAAIDQRPQITGRAGPAMPGQAIDHGRCREHGGARPALDRVENLRRVEAATFRRHLTAAAGQMRQDVKARPMAHRRGMQDRSARLQTVDGCEIGPGHGGDIAMGQHRAFGPSGCPGRIEQPGEVVRPDIAQPDPVGTQQPLMLRGGEADHRNAFGQSGCRRVGQIVRHEHGTGLGVLQDERDLAFMQLAIDRHRAKAGPPDRIEGFSVIRAVFREDGDIVPCRQTETAAKPACQARDPQRALPEVAHHPAADTDGRQVAERLRRTVQPDRQIHRMLPQDFLFCRKL